MREIFKGFALAVSMLTTVPFFKVHDFYKGINGYAVMFYPLVGFLLGLVLWGIHSVLTPYAPSLHVGIIIFVLWVLLTGALHLDGFSDTVDGLYVPKERALEVMKDSHVGGMGMIITASFLIAKASSLANFEAFYLLPIILMLSRAGAVIFIYFYPYVSPNGISTLAKAELTKTQMFIALFYSVVLVAIFDMWLLFVSFLLVLFVIKNFFMKRYGGFTGDIYGFSIEVTELVLLNILLFGLGS
ncbi:MAG: adenosylcobinamide-GDP ribazoletransferase [Sulfurimonas sp. RIFOXYD12_FULL_33_39]|uniref:adenosylcobinamide-GDP ribazoletransferase n=1 Tax=unclassified Sulfurimonas TaxID=2623549 RepID=UPI0008BC8AEF|nr:MULTISPECIES: adenosylcobinamide-GDP ribazoletransferase [unclassified Sulfurimonas]OHE10808.1 MAG: adenosylcobinamide-GDP ribazoletransferase [Sulfurimonas sp. RIFOXYD12_FULL_33_39]OHE13422.1 MAG: adenosylcobinamide-GDP ribazoletransferase [Sulfurimonas sp. RIFOXYD2_FULL_34_21]DAB28766.1 MAG TPA: adenosylcobinamide-GDP ribazoletransferase [Sulfurimonas sp. UBA10385]